MDLARYVHSIVRKGARTDEPIYEQIARLIADGKYLYEVQKQFNTWAQETQRLVDVSAVGLLHELIKHCRLLEPAQEILTNLLERMECLNYVPFVFDGIGVALPVRVEGDFDKQSNEPLVVGLESPNLPTVGKEFCVAIKRGRSRAVEMLKRRGLSLPYQNSKSRWLSLISDNVHQGSIQFSVAILLFCQHPRLCSLTIPNPEAVVTGPITSDSLEPKFQSLTSVGGASRLLMISTEPLDCSEKTNVSVHWPEDYNGVYVHILLSVTGRSLLRATRGFLRSGQTKAGTNHSTRPRIIVSAAS